MDAAIVVQDGMVIAHSGVKKNWGEVMKKWFWGFLVVIVMGVFLVSTAVGGGLNWKGVSLESYGLYKGGGLPLSPGIFNTYAFPNGGKQLVEGVPPNLVLGVGIVNIYSANKLYDSSGDRVSGTHEIDALTFFPRIVYYYPFQPNNPKIRLFTDFIVPISTIHANLDLWSDLDDSTGAVKSYWPHGAGAGGGGVGDIVWAPVALQWAGYGSENVKFSGFIDPLIIFPTGDYKKENLFNLGSNVYTLDFIVEYYLNFPKLGNYGGLQFHNFLCYTISGKNKDFVLFANPGFNQLVTGKTKSTYDTGDVFTANFDLNYPVSKVLTVGLNLCYIQQVTDDKLDGEKISDSKEMSLALGPNLYYINGAFSISWRTSFEVKAENRFKGVNNWMLVTYVF